MPKVLEFLGPCAGKSRINLKCRHLLCKTTYAGRLDFHLLIFDPLQEDFADRGERRQGQEQGKEQSMTEEKNFLLKPGM